MSLADDFDSIGAAPKKGGAAPAAATPAAASAAPSSLADQFDATPTKAAAKPAAPAQKQPAAQGHETGPLDIIGGAVEPIATMATGALGSLVGGATRLGAAALGSSYKDAQATGNKVADALTYHPQTQGGQQALAGLGESATGIKNAVMGSPVGPAISAVGKAYDDTFVKGATNPLMATINDQVPTVTANLVAPAAINAIKGAPNALRAAIAKPAAVAERTEPSIGGAQAAPQAAPSAAAQAAPAAAAPNASAQGATLRGVGAAEANMNPYAGMTGEEAARGGSSAFPQVKTSKIAADVPEADQIKRAQIANEILGEDHGQVRPGVVTGNEDALRSEYTHAKSSDNTPAQVALREQIAHEQTALSNYAQQRIDATGANPNLINNEQRGQVINDAFHGEGGLSDYFKQAKNQIYDAARAQSGDNPIQSSHVDALLKDPQFLAEAERNGHTGVVSGAQKLIELARSTGFKDPITGEVTSPGSVAAWDAVRKSNNAGWSPDNSRTIAAINRAIDQDVAGAAGSDAYKLGDAIHRAEKTVMDVPAISKIFGGADANGIKDGTSLEKLTSKLNNMPLDQWRHVYNTLDDLSRGIVRGAPEGMPPVPQELQQLAGAARNEIAGSLAREVHEQGAGKTGVWNQNSVNKTLNSVVGQKIIETFPPDEVQRFHTLNYGGQIMPGVHSYEGAALQKQRLSKPGFIENHVAKATSALGGAIGGAISGGAAAGAGAGAGSWVGNKLAGRSAASRLEGEANKLREIMRANSKLGQ
jgi:hypothetical protein